MGRIAIFATDILLCLFGVFAVLREIVPHHEFLPPNFPFVEIQWSGRSHETCIIYSEVNAPSGTRVLTEPSDAPVSAFDTSKKLCILRRPLDSSLLAGEVAVQVVLPLLSAADCGGASIKMLSESKPLGNCDSNLSHFVARFSH